jgi:hypothetical protein
MELTTSKEAQHAFKSVIGNSVFVIEKDLFRDAPDHCCGSEMFYPGSWGVKKHGIPDPTVHKKSDET